MVEWHHWLNENKFEQTLGNGEGQDSLTCCSPRGCKWLSDWTTAMTNFTKINMLIDIHCSTTGDTPLSFPEPHPKQYLFACMLSHFSQVQLFATLWTVAHQTPLSMGFSWQEYWGGLPCPSQSSFPIQRSNLHLLSLQHLQAESLELSLIIDAFFGHI